MNAIDKEFSKLVMEIKKKFKGNIYDNYAGNNLGSAHIRYIAALKDHRLLDELKSFLKSWEGLSLKDLNIPYFSSVYIESIHGFNILILTVNDEYKCLEQSVINYGTDSRISNALQEAVADSNIASLQNYNMDTTSNVVTAVDLNIADSQNITIDHYYDLQSSNTQKEFVRVYNTLRSKHHTIDNIDLYYHIDEFALLYYGVINVISDIYKQEPDASGFVIHDAGASSCQLSLMLATLPAEELMGLKVKEVIGTDLKFMDNNSHALNYLKQSGNHRPASFVETDYTDESRELPQSDVTILVDVLEHLPDDDTSFHVLERLMERTRKLMVIHVPYEEVPNPAWGHFISFNRNKLKEWASRFPECESLGDAYFFKDGVTYMDKGFLILKKK